ncbi:MAG: hypothetical protein D6736_10530 [Nitrospinota bacterium]|nr:MAG: hypothetical protein D6736_10530 [Nitrospinota bacterium]
MADYLDPRPRDFTLGSYKLRTTESGEPPLDEDLFQTISRGIPGTAMQGFASILSPEERWQVIYFLKSFAADLFEEPPVRAEIGPEPQVSVEKGKEVYQRAKCWECHGQEGRGDGPSAAKLKDDWGFPILPRDLSKGWRYKGGTTLKEIFTRFTTGMDGTPMPSYADSLSEEDRWHLAAYVQSLIREPARGEPVLRAKRMDRPLPRTPDDPLWREAEPLDVPLSGQVVVAPRWQTPSVDLITVRSLYNDKAIAFLLEWDDRFKNTTHTGEPLPVQDTYMQPALARQGSFRDAVEIQFPVQIPQGAERPYFFLGQPGKPVYLWRWKADRNEDAGKGSPVEELNATGPQNPVLSQPPESQEVEGRGVWKHGRWQVVMIRARESQDRERDMVFQTGKLIPIAFHVWDGANGERGLLCAISSWQFLVLESSTPPRVYVYVFLAVIGSFGVEWWLIRWVRSRSAPSRPDSATRG